jgi:hypothetical protein
VNGLIDRIAQKQHGLATTAQLRDAGLTSRQISGNAARGVIYRVRRGVYRLAGAPITWNQAIRAACLAGGADAVVSHTTAAAVWGFRHSDRHGGDLHLTAHHQLRLPGVSSHTICLGPGDTTVHNGIPVTTAERTIIDLAGAFSCKKLGEVLDDALRRRLVDLERLRRLVTAAGARGGRRLLKPLHRLLSERLRGYQAGGSDWERGMDQLWDQLGLPVGVRQYRVRINGHTYFLDRAIPEHRIGAERNSFKYHHSPTDLDHDAMRTAELSADGWHIIPLTSKTRPEMIRDAVRRIVDDRRRWMTASGGPP